MRAGGGARTAGSVVAHPLVWGTARAAAFTTLAVIAGILDRPTVTWSLLVLADRPDLRRVVIGLAHPGLLLATGIASAVTALVAAEAELHVLL